MRATLQTCTACCLKTEIDNNCLCAGTRVSLSFYQWLYIAAQRATGGRV